MFFDLRARGRRESTFALITLAGLACFLGVSPAPAQQAARTGISTPPGPPVHGDVSDTQEILLGGNLFPGGRMDLFTGAFAVNYYQDANSPVVATPNPGAGFIPGEPSASFSQTFPSAGGVPLAAGAVFGGASIAPCFNTLATNKGYQSYFFAIPCAFRFEVAPATGICRPYSPATAANPLNMEAAATRTPATTILDNRMTPIRGQVSGSVNVFGHLGLVGTGQAKVAVQVRVVDVTGVNLEGGQQPIMPPSPLANSFLICSKKIFEKEISTSLAPSVGSSLHQEAGNLYAGGGVGVHAELEVPLKKLIVNETLEFGFDLMLQRRRTYSVDVVIETKAGLYEDGIGLNSDMGGSASGDGEGGWKGARAIAYFKPGPPPADPAFGGNYLSDNDPINMTARFLDAFSNAGTLGQWLDVKPLVAPGNPAITWSTPGDPPVSHTPLMPLIPSVSAGQPITGWLSSSGTLSYLMPQMTGFDEPPPLAFFFPTQGLQGLMELNFAAYTTAIFGMPPTRHREALFPGTPAVTVNQLAVILEADTAQMIDRAARLKVEEILSSNANTVVTDLITHQIEIGGATPTPGVIGRSPGNPWVGIYQTAKDVVIQKAESLKILLTKACQENINEQLMAADAAATLPDFNPNVAFTALVQAYRSLSNPNCVR